MNVPDDRSAQLPSLSSSLLLRVQQMQPDAWNRLVQTFGPIVYRWSRQSGLAAEDAADVVQDVFTSVANGISSFERRKEQGSFRGWLATITRNRVRDFFRRQQKNPTGRGGTEFLNQIENIPDSLDHSLSLSINEDSLNAAVSQRVLQLVQSEVEPKTWQAFWLTTVDDARATEVAAKLDMSLASVYQAKSRVLRRIRRRLAELP